MIEPVLDPLEPDDPIKLAKPLKAWSKPASRLALTLLKLALTLLIPLAKTMFSSK